MKCTLDEISCYKTKKDNEYPHHNESCQHRDHKSTQLFDLTFLSYLDRGRPWPSPVSVLKKSSSSLKQLSQLSFSGYFEPSYHEKAPEFTKFHKQI